MNLANLAMANPEGLTPTQVRTLGTVLNNLLISLRLSAMDVEDEIHVPDSTPRHVLSNPDGTTEVL